jgi:hypothetical protein
MAAAATVPAHYMYLLKTGAVNEASDTFKIILVNGLTFDPATHTELADVTAYQLPTANGYTQNNKTLSGVSVVENNTLNKAQTTWDDATWTASGGDIGPADGAIVYDDTISGDPIAAYIEFEAAATVPNGFSFQVQAPQLDLAMAS